MELKEQCLFKIDELFSGHLDGLQVQGAAHYLTCFLLSLMNFSDMLIGFFFFLLEQSEFKYVTKEVCKLPSFFSSSLFRKIDVDCIGVVTRYDDLYIRLY